MYRTDKQFMTNPATAPSRVYIGGLPKTIVAADLEEKFKMHGKILGLVLQMGFAFIQFENESQAQAAIQNENNTVLHGRKICVRQALDKSQKGANNMNKQIQNRRPGPPPHYNEPPHMPPQQQQQFQNHPPPPQQQPTEEPPKPAPKPEPEEQAPPPKEEPPKKEAPRGRKRRMQSRERFQPDIYREDGYYPPGKYPNRPPVVDQPDRNDCEIIVVSKPLTKYAEYIEQRLKGLGLIVDLLFPNEDVPIGRVLANISSRGCLYAILVMPQNEEHRSLTLNILHGNPQEHRNMPIEDALVLMTRNFDAYMRGDKTASEPTPGAIKNVSDRHPTTMQLLLNLLAENRQLTTAQYDRLVKYLQERREIQHQHEISEGVDQESQESNSKQAELQSRIMNILNKASTETQPPPQEPTPSNDVAPPLLKDPSVQKALDSLLGGEMFKNIGVV
ncbi:nuclear receptor coactivator 5 [Tribolium madens]|uniref:nuclear receptor coactivator 5 n=1 Tax=Tribolium madens TaxID=41895 RepID=UPI001CF74840|nr:nuclear receptor coactivator 5 [Tribolium madens]